VLESWSRWAAYGVLDDPKLRKLVNHLPSYRTISNIVPTKKNCMTMSIIMQLMSDHGFAESCDICALHTCMIIELAYEVKVVEQTNLEKLGSFLI
jgi:hypothetical protein